MHRNRLTMRPKSGKKSVLARRQNQHAGRVRYPELGQRRLILLHARNRGEYRLVIGDGVICLGPKIEFSVCAVVLALTSAALWQDTVPISPQKRSIPQPEAAAHIEQPSGVVAAEHMTGAWGALRA